MTLEQTNTKIVELMEANGCRGLSIIFTGKQCHINATPMTESESMAVLVSLIRNYSTHADDSPYEVLADITWILKEEDNDEHGSKSEAR